MITLLAIWAGFVKGLVGIGGFIVKNWRIILPVIAILVITLFVYRSCRPRVPKLSEAETIAAQRAIATQDRAVMQQVLVQSEAREILINANVANANKTTAEAISESKAKWANVSNEDMAAELDRRVNQ